MDLLRITDLEVDTLLAGRVGEVLLVGLPEEPWRGLRWDVGEAGPGVGASVLEPLQTSGEDRWRVVGIVLHLAGEWVVELRLGCPGEGEPGVQRRHRLRFAVLSG